MKTAKDLKKHRSKHYHKNMDPSVPTPQNEPFFLSFKKKSLSPIIIVFVLVIAGAGFALVYQYTDILSFKTGQPPAEETASEEITFAPQIVPPSSFKQDAQKGPFTCPALPAFCQNSKNFQEKSLAGKLPADSKIFAAFGGEAESILSVNPKEDGSKEEYTLLLLSNKERGLQAMYYFKGEGPKSKTVASQGEAIGTSDGNPLEFMDNHSLVFRLIKTGKEGGSLTNLSPADFK